MIAWPRLIIFARNVRDTVSSTPANVPFTDRQRAGLDRRLDDLDRDGPTGIPWEEVYLRIRSRSP